ncbi:MAG: hypothetical protein HYU87_02235 [Chloroflexi bacterium]|nr:hypothetical protein [Chloroflexota bacterium]
MFRAGELGRLSARSRWDGSLYRRTAGGGRIGAVQALFIGILLAPVLLGIVLVMVARRYPETRGWAAVAGISVALIPVAIVLHNVLSAIVGGEEGVSFVVALVVAPAGFAVGALGVGLRLARSGRAWEIGVSIAIAGAGMALFVAYMVVALVVTTIERGNPPYQATVQAIVLPVALIALVGGSLSALFCTVVPSRQTLA